MAIQRKTSIDPLLIQVIQNGEQLRNLIAKVDHISDQQQANHAIAMTLKDHNTIERVDTLWITIGEIRSNLRLMGFLVRVILVILPALAAAFAVARVLHWM